MASTTPPEVWFITGIRIGLGREIAAAALAAGHIVIGTVRSGSPEGLSSPNLHVLQLDMNDEAAIVKTVQRAVEIGNGRVDVVVNNAGFSQSGAIEEVTVKQGKELFATNVWALHLVTTSFLPVLRKQRSGRIIQVGSVAGIVTSPGLGVYAASKHAVEALSEALAKEVASFGIKVTIVEPGFFRTNIAGTRIAPENALPDVYDGIRPTGEHVAKNLHGSQRGDPVKLGKIVVELAATPNPPLRLLLGPDAYAVATKKLNSVLENIENNKAITVSTDFDHGQKL